MTTSVPQPNAAGISHWPPGWRAGRQPAPDPEDPSPAQRHVHRDEEKGHFRREGWSPVQNGPDSG